MNRGPRRAAASTAANLLLALGSLLVACLVGEALARRYAHRLEGAPGTTGYPPARYDPELGWSNPPGAAVVIQRPEYRVPLRINAHGLRGPDRPYAKPPGTRRVLLLGDSITEGYSVDEPWTLRSVLESDLDARRGGRYEVINGGTAGYSTDQEYLFYLREGVRYEADDVVLLFCYNDLYPALGGDGGKPYFEIADGRLALRNVPVPRREMTRDLDRRYRVRPWRGSYALRLVSNRTAAGNPDLHELLGRLGLVEPYPDRSPPPDMWPYGLGHPREVDDMWQRVEAVIAALDEDVRRGHHRLLLFYVPAGFESSDRAWDLTRRRYDMGRRWERDRVFEGLRAIAQGRGLTLVDPRPLFREAQASGQATYFPEDGHWTETGNRLAAKVLGDALRPAGREVTEVQRGSLKSMERGAGT